MSQTTEKFTIACPQCGEVVAVSQAHVGKKGRCKVCHAVFPIVAPVAGLQPVGSSQDDEFALSSLAPVAASSPMNSMAQDYLKQASEYKGGTLQQLEDESGHRFNTSYGSVIGGIVTIVLGLLLMAIVLFFFMSFKLAAACVLMILAGIGWLVQGLNYITYYKWKDGGGRDKDR
jgi:hypothetical protein